MKRITDLTHRPRIGHTYLVPCVEAPQRFGGGTQWVPVLLPAHDDNEYLQVPYKHYHNDFRFVDDPQWLTGGIVPAYHIIPAEGKTVEYKEMKCIRHNTDFPVPNTNLYYFTGNTEPLPSWAALQNGHALKWNIATGNLIPRT